MTILITGRAGQSGSFQIRAEQLGLAAGLKLVPNADHIVGQYDAAVIVKRPRIGAVDALRRAKIPIFWDVVDAHPQPAGNLWNRKQCMEWFRSQVAIIRPAAIIAATDAMNFDAAEFGCPVKTVRHHARHWQALNPVRDNVKIVAYEGGLQYIDRWSSVVDKECVRRGWRFVFNPASFADIDIVVALRDQRGYAPTHWKSNVKLANAMGSGTPIVCNREAGYLETSSGAEQWADTPEELVNAFDALTPHDVRKRVSAHLYKAAPKLETIARDYRQWLETLI